MGRRIIASWIMSFYLSSIKQMAASSWGISTLSFHTCWLKCKNPQCIQSASPLLSSSYLILALHTIPGPETPEAIHSSTPLTPTTQSPLLNQNPLPPTTPFFQVQPWSHWSSELGVSIMPTAPNWQVIGYSPFCPFTIAGQNWRGMLKTLWLLVRFQDHRSPLMSLWARLTPLDIPKKL